MDELGLVIDDLHTHNQIVRDYGWSLPKLLTLPKFCQYLNLSIESSILLSSGLKKDDVNQVTEWKWNPSKLTDMARKFGKSADFTSSWVDE